MEALEQTNKYKIKQDRRRWWHTQPKHEADRCRLPYGCTDFRFEVDHPWCTSSFKFLSPPHWYIVCSTVFVGGFMRISSSPWKPGNLKKDNYPSKNLTENVHNLAFANVVLANVALANLVWANVALTHVALASVSVAMLALANVALASVVLAKLAVAISASATFLLAKCCFSKIRVSKFSFSNIGFSNCSSS